jgi:hypothetical protein
MDSLNHSQIFTQPAKFDKISLPLGAIKKGNVQQKFIEL